MHCMGTACLSQSSPLLSLTEKTELRSPILYTNLTGLLQCFLLLSLPGDYRVTDEALLAETT